MDYYILITEKKQRHLIEWLRFIQDLRPKTKLTKKDRCIIDFRNAGFLYPDHICTLACLIEEYFLAGARLRFKYKMKSGPGRFVYYTKFDKYWNKDFDRNNCFQDLRKDILPVWQTHNERINPYADLSEAFYKRHISSNVDLTVLRLSVVEALNNIHDHSESKVKGFVYSEFAKGKSELSITICDFGVGIVNKVNSYLRKIEQKELSPPAALDKAFEENFTTKSKPNNAGKGLATILSYLQSSEGEIEVISNKAMYSNRIKNDRQLATISEEIKLNFSGTIISIRLNTNKFKEKEKEVQEELNLF